MFYDFFFFRSSIALFFTSGISFGSRTAIALQYFDVFRFIFFPPTQVFESKTYAAVDPFNLEESNQKYLPLVLKTGSKLDSLRLNLLLHPPIIPRRNIFQPSFDIEEIHFKYSS
jgi:hypothetical protein